MKKNLAFFVFGTIIFFLFVFFSFLVNKDFFTAFDFDTTVRLQDNISRKFDEFFSLFSLIGNFEFATLFLFFLLLLRRKLLGIFVIFFYGLFHVIELFGKTFIDHLPPPHFMLRVEKIGDFPQFYVSAENSYPSGHSARAVFLSVILIFFFLRSKKLSKIQKYIFFLLIFLYDLIMFTSRVYLGEHWTTDVIGGGLLGLALGLISVIFI